MSEPLPDPADPPARPPADSETAAAAESAPAGSESAPAGPELARAMLDAAKARRPAGKRRRGSGDDPGSGGAPGGGRRGWSGAGADPRDPQPVGAVLAKLVKARGWQRPAAEATLFGQWERVVGAEIADHCRPVRLADGELTVEAASTTWATQLRLLAGSLLKQIAAQVGHNVVTRLRVHGPAAPSWNRGPRHVRGRGPRDTYG